MLFWFLPYSGYMAQEMAKISDLTVTGLYSRIPMSIIHSEGFVSLQRASFTGSPGRSPNIECMLLLPKANITVIVSQVAIVNNVWSDFPFPSLITATNITLTNAILIDGRLSTGIPPPGSLRPNIQHWKDKTVS